MSYTDDWKKAKQAYFTLTGEKKPKEKFLKFFSTSHTKLSGSIANCEEWLDWQPPSKTKADLAKLLEIDNQKRIGKALAEFEAASDAYIRELDKLITEEKKLTFKDKEDESNKMTTPRLKGLKMLKTRLESYLAGFKRKEMDRRANIDGWSRLETYEKGLKLGLKKGFTTARAATAAIRANPTVKTWNAEMDQGFRTLTTALVVYETLVKMYANEEREVPPNLRKEAEQAKTWITRLSTWANDKRVLELKEDDKVPEQLKVLEELKPAAQALKECLAVYKDYL
jgi:hypothetical protein